MLSFIWGSIADKQIELVRLLMARQNYDVWRIDERIASWFAGILT